MVVVCSRSSSKQVNMVLNVHRNHKASLLGAGWGEGGMEVGGREIIYLSLHHRNDFCVKMGSDESHFNVSLIVRDEITRQCQQTTNFEEKRAEADKTQHAGTLLAAAI